MRLASYIPTDTAEPEIYIWH